MQWMGVGVLRIQNLAQIYLGSVLPGPSCLQADCLPTFPPPLTDPFLKIVLISLSLL